MVRQFSALKQLNDTNFYKPLSASIYLQTAALIRHTVYNMLYQGFISKSQHRFLIPSTDPRPRHFCTLPKIHKPNDKWTISNILPSVRPIVSGCNNESAAVEQSIDFNLQPIATSIPSYIRGSSHFKSLLNDLHIDHSHILFTLDVKSLYSNISIQQDIASVKKLFLNTLAKVDLTNTYLSSLNALYFVITLNLIRTSFFKSKAPPWAKNTLPHLPTFSCTSGNNKLFLPPILLPSFGNGILMTFLAFFATL